MKRPFLNAPLPDRPCLPAGTHADFLSDLREASDEIAALLDQNSHLVPFLEATMEGSPYLRGLMLRDAVFAGRCLSENPEALIIEVLKEARESWKTTDNEKSLMAALRLGKRRAAPVSYTHLTLPTICSV